jgi:hypothetical protein
LSVASIQLCELFEGAVEDIRAGAVFSLLTIHPDLLKPSGTVSRAVMAQALNMVLFNDLLERVPAAKAYAQDCLREGRKVFHDHGAVRTVVLAGMGDLPSGQDALLRVLTPLGYGLNGIYPLERLRMTGRSYAQADYPADIAQFFISELHVDRFSPAFQAAAASVTASSRDPLTPDAQAVLDEFAREGEVSPDEAAAALPALVACFGRQHGDPRITDYEALLAESAEMAWIATEGNAFNHATDRVDDVDAVAAAQKALGRPMKEAIEVSGSGRVRQTAFRAAQVTRTFRDNQNNPVDRSVPGSFYEFITRAPMVDEKTGEQVLDLAFDSSNAQGIFKMTEAAR